MAETHDARELVEAQAAERDPDFFPLNDLPNDVLVSVFDAVGDLRWVRHTFPLVCRAWNELYLTKDASPLHETLELDFDEEVERAEAATAAPRAAAPQTAAGAEATAADSESESDSEDSETTAAESEFESEWEEESDSEEEDDDNDDDDDDDDDGDDDDDDEDDEEEEDEDDEEEEDDDDSPVVHASRVISWAQGRAGSVLKLDLKGGEFCEPLKDFKAKDLGALVAVVGPSLTEISIGRDLGQLCKKPFWESLRTSVVPARRLRSFVVDNIGSVVKMSDVKPLGQLAGSLEELVLQSEGEGLRRFPESFLALEELRRLVLVGHPRITSIPAGISSLQKLEELDLRSCDLSSLPSELVELSGLTKLDLEGNKEIGTTPEDEAFPAELGKMTSLRGLSLSDCLLRTIPATLGELESLERLNLSENDLSLPPEDLGQLSGRALKLAKMTSLRELDLSHCFLRTFPAFVGKLKSLERLALWLNELPSLPKELGELSGLTELDLSFNPNLGTFPDELGNMKSLRVLNLTKCRPRTVPAFVCKLESLEVLRLHSCGLSSLPKELGELSGLTTLILGGNKHLGKALPAAEAFPGELGKMKSLRLLDLENCGLRAVPAFVGELKSLEVLELGSNDLPSLPKELGELSGLTELDLSFNPNLGTFPDELGNMKSLQVLNLTKCRLRTVPAFLGKLKSLEKLVLARNDDLQIDAPLDFLIEGCPSLRTVWLDRKRRWTLESLAHLEDFKAKLRAKNPNTEVSF